MVCLTTWDAGNIHLELCGGYGRCAQSVSCWLRLTAGLWWQAFSVYCRWKRLGGEMRQTQHGAAKWLTTPSVECVDPEFTVRPCPYFNGTVPDRRRTVCQSVTELNRLLIHASLISYPRTNERINHLWNFSTVRSTMYGVLQLYPTSVQQILYVACRTRCMRFVWQSIAYWISYAALLLLKSAFRK